MPWWSGESARKRAFLPDLVLNFFAIALGDVPLYLRKRLSYRIWHHRDWHIQVEEEVVLESLPVFQGECCKKVSVQAPRVDLLKPRLADMPKVC